MKLVFMLEEASMKAVLDLILPKILPPNVSFQTISHNGKSDLRKSIPIKLRGWSEPDVQFIIVHDQDSSDCFQLKQHLSALCNPYGRNVLVRIACRELESWYFGDLKAVSLAYNQNLVPLSEKRKYRIPDAIENPKEELKRLVPKHQQISGARMIASHMDPCINTSQSFNALVHGIKRICG